MLRIRRRTSLRPNSFRRDPLERRSGMNLCHDVLAAISAANKPVLTIAPGDSVHTTTVDAGGTDEKGRDTRPGRKSGDGPFYVETAAPGDTLAVHLTWVRLILTGPRAMTLLFRVRWTVT